MAKSHLSTLLSSPDSGYGRKIDFDCLLLLKGQAKNQLAILILRPDANFLL
jgi:hypothetical protein